MPAAQDADPLVTAERVERRDDARALDTVLLIVGLVALWQVGIAGARARRAAVAGRDRQPSFSPS